MGEPRAAPRRTPGQDLDADAVRRWCRIALDAVGGAREEIDAINVYPVADGDTGTNLYLTLESAAQAVAAAATGRPTLAEAVRGMAHGALIGARGNSGTILAQLLRGMAEVLAEAGTGAGTGAGTESGVEGGQEHGGADADAVRRALRRAAAGAYEAVARPVEGTMLTVATAAAEAAERAPGDSAAEVVAAACVGARRALAATPGQLPVLAAAGVVDAGGSGLVAVLDALDAALSGRAPDASLRERLGRAGGPGAVPGAAGAECPVATRDSYEVIYLLEAGDEATAALRGRLDALGDSLVIGGGDGLWHVHLHTAEPGAAVEAGIEAGRPHRIRITALAVEATTPQRPPRAAGRAVVAVLPGEGLAGLCAEAGAATLTARPGEAPGAGELTAAVHAAGAAEVVLLPNDDELWHAAAAAAEQARVGGVRAAVVPTRSPVQGLAALAVHAPERRFDEDVVAMTAAARATRFGEVDVAERQSWTMAGVCQAGDVLGLVDGDVVLIGHDPAEVAGDVLERMLAGGGELVTLVLGATAPAGLADRLTEQVRRGHLGVDTVVCAGGQSAPLLIGVE
ncbi:DAK2 domain-containing protein [Streptomyces sp. 8K308]|uniref:DAK2 domain-containing protein n=1 Tax=Streptomyces sp. 8K308 TaxID=2530388 RepID=UPI001047CB84|nr:DAK2 domain-containing protein [Streptomyces sp. 8K308]TDC20129.1 DAK2 domain-containing protein [Streptomyces sp. 8K308]